MKLTKAEVQEFLQGRTDNKISGVTPISTGEWTQPFFYQENNVQKVIRFGGIDEDFRRDQFAYGFNSPKLSIPKIEEIGEVFGGYFAISRKAGGEMINDLGPEEIKEIIPKLMELFEALRKTDISKSRGYGGLNPNGDGTSKSWKDFMKSVTEDNPGSRTYGWKQRLMERKSERKVFDLAYRELLSTIIFCPEERHIIHSDLLHFNLLVENGDISAVIDWGCAKYGDFLYDLSCFIFWQFWYPSMEGIDFKNEARQYFVKIGVDLPNFEIRLKSYQLHIGLDSLKYCSFKGNWKHAEMVAKRLIGVIR